MKRTVLALQPLLTHEMDVLEQGFNVLRLWESQKPESVIRDHSHEIVGILSTYNGSGVSKRLMEALPNLEIIAQFGVGYDNIDLVAAQERDIVVTNTPDVLTDDTADVALFLMLNVARRAVEADMFVRVGRWHSGAMPLSTSISGKTVGIVGLGSIGQAIAQRAAAFNTKVIYHSRTKKDAVYTYYKDLKEMAVAADFLILACAGGDETKHLINYEILDALGAEGFLINIARGSVVKEDDLLIALRNKSIAGAGLDVYADEPNVPEEMIKMDNVVLSPHVGSATVETRSKMGQLVIDNLTAHFDGQPLLTPIKMAS
ncbi:MAG: hydroxyacid dehydrogenase [Alphaproteobacteria bacterium]|nr:MAG: hydroxyacid dehydrogenase [Alphaproteobacteria bacterium]